MYAFRSNDLWTEWDGGPRPNMGGAPMPVPALWSDAEKKARFGLWRVAIDPIPAGKVIVSSALVDREGTPALEHTFADSPGQVPDRVSRRKFRRQLLRMPSLTDNGTLLDDVEAWVAQQTREIRESYLDSGEFVRTEPMMQLGFAAMGFSKQQIDEFFIAAGAL